MVKFLKTFQLFGILDPETHARATVEVWAVHMCSGLGFQKNVRFQFLNRLANQKAISQFQDLPI